MKEKGNSSPKGLLLQTLLRYLFYDTVKCQWNCITAVENSHKKFHLIVGFLHDTKHHIRFAATSCMCTRSNERNNLIQHAENGMHTRNQQAIKWQVDPLCSAAPKELLRFQGCYVLCMLLVRREDVCLWKANGRLNLSLYSLLCWTKYNLYAEYY